VYYFLKLKGEELKKFNQAKFDYYKKVNSFGAIIVAVTSIFYFISDCQIVGAFSWNTLLPRTFIWNETEKYPVFSWVYEWL
jgi:hypothetical protein